MMEIKILPVTFMLHPGNAKVIFQERRLRLAGKKKSNRGYLNTILQANNVFSLVRRLARSKGISRTEDKKEFKVGEALWRLP